MWHWDQGRLEYFQFNIIQKIAAFAINHDLKTIDRATLQTEIGLPFTPDDINYPPWRNYSRVFRLCLLVNVQSDRAIHTPVAELLSVPGKITSDEYFHFLACSFSDPTPALKNWLPSTYLRYPLLFALKYLLAMAATNIGNRVTIDTIIALYQSSNFKGDEDQDDFINLIRHSQHLISEFSKNKINKDMRRQSRESLLVLAQISYLHVTRNEIVISLHPEDATDAFNELSPISGTPQLDREMEIARLSSYFQGGSTNTFFDYPHTVVGEFEINGFAEGSKTRKTHIVIERNSGLLREYFLHNQASVCDLCCMDTQNSYPWAARILDLHHLLPLSCGTNVKTTGTVFSDLIPICPSCHRATHRYYDKWLNEHGCLDFSSKEQAHQVYNQMKSNFNGICYAP
jgi:hypothetical protein